MRDTTFDNLHKWFKDDEWYIYDSFMHALIKLDLSDGATAIYGVGPGVCS